MFIKVQETSKAFVEPSIDLISYIKHLTFYTLYM